ncbi:ATP-binding cassette subfamily B protein/ATP-binding cassette subfamily C protein/ATP-binding cassette subfamily C protein LapB [Sinobacterium caligoides]|uniref:ATP-binding cassette subfamily B protein/ATP-binding cassette subfamily C protein/ATP-binding cassette subfamily C protein LapB n=1 Tax=Sinobacterium caligoides TaxID=933926 RepID=A0A3N2DJF5_9GAMM|nr:type I secretion system permease/ATPase [Sinobacterium caligoides]ROR99915.1 ATP-binding cassette subfamily B protein/ATP-binding cassette subfamily C protein/ATP-binding cassette subfamily C protein LapB [Sinobacterium caligoides]
MPSKDLLLCLQRLTEHFGYQGHSSRLLEGLPTSVEVLTLELLPRAATLARLDCREININELKRSPLPLIAPLKEQEDRALIITSVNGNNVTTESPVDDFTAKTLPLSELTKSITDTLYLLTPIQLSDARSEQLQQYKKKHWLRSAFEKSKPWYRDLILASFVVNVLALVIPLFTMNVYDRVVPNQAFASLWVLAIGAGIAVLFDWFLKQARTALTDIAGKHVDAEVSSGIFAKVMGMQLENKPESLGAFSKQVQDFDSVRDFLTSATLIAAIDLPFTLLFIIIIGWLGGPMVLVPITIILFLITLSLLLQRKMKASLDETSRLSCHRHAQLLESLSVIAEAKQNNAQGILQRRWEHATGALADWQSNTKSLTNTLSHSLASSQQLVTVMLIIYGVYRISEGLLSMGGLIAIVMLSGRTASSINQLAMLVMRYQQTKTAVESVESVMNLPQENQVSRQINRADFEGQVQLKDVSFKYPNQKASVLQHIDLEVNSGERVALMGPPGAGKSTLLALLAYQYRPSEGQIYFDGIEANQWPCDILRKKTGWVAQQPILQYGTILENMAFGLGEIEKDNLKQALIRSGVVLFIDQLENGLETNVGEGGMALSGGQRQSVGLARALLRQPSFLLLDEPTSSIDEKGEGYIIQQLKKLPNTTTTIIATHRQSILSICDRVIQLEQGKIVRDIYQPRKADISHRNRVKKVTLTPKDPV